MVVGLEAVFPGGQVTRIKNVPRRAAGPDIRHVVIGSEGALCFITEVTVKLFRYQPENNRYFGFLVDDFADGIAALRELITAGYRPSVCRVYSPEDARQHFADFYQGKNVVVLIAEGPKGIADATAEAIEELFAGRPHERVEPGRIQDWFENLNWGQDKIDAEKADMLAARPPRIHHRSVRRLVTGQRPVRRRHGPDPQRVPAGRRPDHARRALLAQLPDRDQPVLRLRLHDQLRPREEIEVYHKPLNAIIVTRPCGWAGRWCTTTGSASTARPG